MGEQQQQIVKILGVKNASSFMKSGNPQAFYDIVSLMSIFQVLFWSDDLGVVRLPTAVNVLIQFSFLGTKIARLLQAVQKDTHSFKKKTS